MGVVCVALVCGCKGKSGDTEGEKETSVATTDSILVQEDEEIVMPTVAVVINEADYRVTVEDAEVVADTLKLLVTSHFPCYPFGFYTAVADLQSRLPEHEVISNQIDDGMELLMFHGEGWELMIKTGFNSYYYQVPSVELVEGVVFSDEVILDKGVRVGMSRTAFCKALDLESYQHDLSDVMVVEFITMFDDFRTIYSFEEGVLSSITWVNVM